MLELNKVMLVGNLTRDPELSHVPSGSALAKMGLAMNRRWRAGNGEAREETTFVDVEAWGKTAEFCSKYLAKGRRVFIEGRLRLNQWETQSGEKRSKLSVTADRVEFADAKPKGGGDDGFPDTPAADRAPAGADDGAGDDLPF